MECAPDATCTFDTEKKSAYCKCTDIEQTFDDGDKKCKRMWLCSFVVQLYLYLFLTIYTLCIHVKHV